MTNSNKFNEVRLHKAIADSGVTSRRKAEELITEGKVKVNDEVVTTLGTKIDPYKDIVAVDDEVIDLSSNEKIYILLNKPRGYVTTVHDPEGRPTVIDLCRGINTRIFPVGRLDYLSEGLLLLTNDGDLANIILHPRYEVMKVYEVKVFGIVPEDLLRKIKRGVRDDGELLKPHSVRVVKHLNRKTWLEFRLKEGKNREIRRICEAFDLTVDKLKRVAIEGLSIEGIAPGKYSLMDKKQLLKSLNMKENGEKIIKNVYRSSKKTVNAKKRGKSKNTSWANDSKYRKYRKKNYNQTMKSYKNNKKNENEN
ncbi:MAG: pseudouridine synthase [Bacteriovoracia bacterium]